MNQKVPQTAFIIGCGQRGFVYSQYAQEFPDKLKIVAIAEPRKITREKMQKLYNINPENVFEDYRNQTKSKQKIADIVIIALQDKDHLEAALICAEIGYHIILEKPIAVQKQECIDIVEACKKHKVMLYVCHVLRYAPWNTKIKELIKDGKIGDIINIQHYEPVGWEHFSHSYVRGNWKNTEESSFSLMAKCCHDVDLILWWAGSDCKKISSFGNLHHFKKSKKPQNASNNCLDCPVERECPYSAVKQYIDPLKEGKKPKFGHILVEETPDIENLTEAIKTGPYGKCVYDCNNDVVDHQVVNFEFENGATSTLTMSAFTEAVCTRKTHITGTHGEIILDNDVVNYIDFRNKQKQQFFCPENPSKLLYGHNGADFYLVDSFINDLNNQNYEKIQENFDISLKSHLMVFAAEESRLQNKIINF